MSVLQFALIFVGFLFFCVDCLACDVFFFFFLMFAWFLQKFFSQFAFAYLGYRLTFWLKNTHIQIEAYKNNHNMQIILCQPVSKMTIGFAFGYYFQWKVSNFTRTYLKRNKTAIKWVSETHHTNINVLLLIYSINKHQASSSSQRFLIDIFLIVLPRQQCSTACSINNL